MLLAAAAAFTAFVSSVFPYPAYEHPYTHKEHKYINDHRSFYSEYIAAFINDIATDY